MAPDLINEVVQDLADDERGIVFIVFRQEFHQPVGEVGDSLFRQGVVGQRSSPGSELG